MKVQEVALTDYIEEAFQSESTEAFENLLDTGVITPNTPLKPCSSRFYTELPAQLPLNLALNNYENQKVVELLLKEGADINAALNSAVELNACEGIEFLLKRGADPFYRTSNYDLSGSNDVPKNSSITTRLIYRCLINSDFEEPELDSEDQGLDDLIGIFRCPKEYYDLKEKMMLRTLLDFGSKLPGKSKKRQEQKKYAILMKSILNNDTKGAQKILENILDVDFLNIKEYSPSLFAIRLQKNKIVEFLLKKGIDVKKLIFPAVRFGNSNIVKLCLDEHKKRYPDIGINRIVNTEQDTLLTYAASNNDLGLVKLLVNDYRLTVEEIQNNDGRNPLFNAVIINKYDSCGVLKYLLQHEVLNVNMVDNYGTALLDVAQVCKVYALLLEHGANPLLSASRPTEHHCITSALDCDILDYYEKVYAIDSEFTEQTIAQFDSRMKKRWMKRKTKIDIDQYQKSLDELKKVKIKTFAVMNTKISLYDMLFFKPNTMARLSSNKDLIEMFNKTQHDFARKYYQYGFALNSQLRRGLRRRELLTEASECISFALGSEMPGNLTYEIFQYFSDKQLKLIKSNLINQELMIYDYENL